MKKIPPGKDARSPRRGEQALRREARPEGLPATAEVRALHERIADIAHDASHLGNRRKGRPFSKRQIDDLWMKSR